MVFQGNRRRISRHRRSIKERLYYRKFTANEGRSFEYYRALGGVPQSMNNDYSRRDQHF